MTIYTTTNETWGFYGTINVQDKDAAWRKASRSLRKYLVIKPLAVRDLLDSKLGRHLADQVNCKINPNRLKAIDLTVQEWAQKGWFKGFNVAEGVKTKKELTLEKIARDKLFFETLETRNSDSLDFQDTAVWQVKAALEAAYQAGLEAAKK